MNKDDLRDKIGTALMAFDEVIKETVKELSYEELTELAKDYEAMSKIHEQRNFEMPIYHYISEQIEGERNMRIVFNLAEEHMKRTGSSYYCVYCGGDCTPEHIAMRDD